MVRFAAGMLLGVLPVGWLGSLPPWWCTVLAIAVVPACLLGRRRWPLVAGMALGLALALATVQARAEHAIDAGLEGQTLTVDGTVAGLPQERARSTRFRFAVDQAERGGRAVTVPRTIRLNWYADDRPSLRPGTRARLRVRVERPRGFANPGTFDYALWLLREGIGATGYVREALQVEPASGPFAGLSLQRIRHGLRTRLQGLLPDDIAGGILLALALGEREDIEPGAWSVLRATGTTHLVAISGLHIGIVALIGFQLGRIGWWFVRRSSIPRPVPQAWFGVTLAAAYAALAGFALPTVRALIMLSVALATVVLRRRARAPEGLATAAVAVLLYDPLAPLGASFWLSFGAVAAILLLVTGRIAPVGRTRRWLGLQFGLCLALTPLLFGFFGQASIVAPLANAVAIPWVSLLIVPITLLATMLADSWPALAGWLFDAAAAALGPLWASLEVLAGWPLSEWHVPQPPIGLLLLAAAGTALLLAPRGLPARPAGLLAMFPLLFWTPQPPPVGGVRLDLLDVGQGLAAVVRTHEHTLVYDTGARFSQRFDAGSAVVVPFLRAQGVRRIDALVVSHLDNDHAGGRDAVIEGLRPETTWSSGPHRLEHPARLCARGRRWNWDGVVFRFLHPDPDDALTGNDASCVLRIDAPGGSLLLPGDIEAPAERLLLARDARLDADVVVAPHHGSATSSTPAFVTAVDPEQVLYPVGYRNRWDFPRPEVVRRWSPARSMGTDCAGAITLRIGPSDGVGDARGWRQRTPRFWRAGCADVDKSGTMRSVEPGGAPAKDGG